jgi:hypothetical protein
MVITACPVLSMDPLRALLGSLLPVKDIFDKNADIVGRLVAVLCEAVSWFCCVVETEELSSSSWW